MTTIKVLLLRGADGKAAHVSVCGTLSFLCHLPRACLPFPLACEVRPLCFFSSTLPSKKETFSIQSPALDSCSPHHTHRPHYLPAPCACLHILDSGVRGFPKEPFSRPLMLLSPAPYWLFCPWVRSFSWPIV
ncbi:hypothetical protein BC567DRAFT_225423 [Phyllosticta citribraziliensis]